MTDPEWEGRPALAWAQASDQPAPEPRPGSPLAAFERACSWHASGHHDRAAALYRQALEGGLDEHRRRRAVIQLADALRSLGEAAESVRLLSQEQDSDELDDAVRAYLALALAECGREREGLAVALAALARHVPCYQRALGEQAREL